MLGPGLIDGTSGVKVDGVVGPEVEEVLVQTLVVTPDQSSRNGRRERRAERRRLRRLDALSAHLAELHAIRALLEQTETVVSDGWVQGAWFTVASGGGHRAVTAYDVGLAMDRPVTGACLVGGVVHAAGGPSSVRSQLVQRTLDLTWHALRGDPDQPVRWCPGPRARMVQVLELTYWNDAPGRTREDVAELLRRARGTVAAELRRSRAEQLTLTSA